MSFQVKEFNIKSCDGVHTLIGKLYIPHEEIKGIFHLVHGMNEYIDRYEYLFSVLAENGYISAGFDNLGHGNTADKDQSFGFIAHKNGWQLLVDDVINFGQSLKAEFPEMPLYLMGHSMGSFIARLAAEQNSNLYKKVVFCGTAGKNPLAKMGIMLTATIKKLMGERYISKLCHNIAFGGYNKKFEDGNPNAWLTADRQITKNYSVDKFCNYKFSVSAMQDLIVLIDKCNRKKWYLNFNKTLPVFLIAGEMDPVGNYSKGVIEIFDGLKAQNCDVSLKLYKDARHEIHNDFCREEVISDILKFLKGEK